MDLEIRYLEDMLARAESLAGGEIPTPSPLPVDVTFPMKSSIRPPGEEEAERAAAAAGLSISAAPGASGAASAAGGGPSAGTTQQDTKTSADAAKV